MQIERTLNIPLRSFIERVVEDKEELSSSKVLVDKDKGKHNNKQHLNSENKPKEDSTPQLASNIDNKIKAEVKPELTHRLDLLV